MFLYKHEFNNFGDIKKKKRVFTNKYFAIMMILYFNQQVDSRWILFNLLKMNEFFSPIKQFLSSFTGFSRYVIAMNILFPITYVAEEQGLIKKFITRSS